MLLADWIKKTGIVLQECVGCKCIADVGDVGNASSGLWDLIDYVVSSRHAGTIWLVPIKLKRDKLNPSQRATLMNVRNFMMLANEVELRRELEISLERGDEFRAACVRELIIEVKASE
jgi:hypothetical protein